MSTRNSVSGNGTSELSTDFSICGWGTFIHLLSCRLLYLWNISDQSHQPISHTKDTLPTSCTTSEFFEKPLFSSAEKRRNLYGDILTLFWLHKHWFSPSRVLKNDIFCWNNEIFTKNIGRQRLQWTSPISEWLWLIPRDMDASKKMCQ